MNDIQEKKIGKLSREFYAQKGYLNRLTFFGQQFTVIPTVFPLFDHSLSFLNNAEKVIYLTELYRRESDLTASLKMEFNFGRKNYVFDVRPFNSGRASFNSFVIEKFISEDNNFNEIIRSIENSGQYNEQSVTHLLEESNEVLLELEAYLQKNKSRSFMIRFMTVFYNGYKDFLWGVPKSFQHKKKFIELYLYSQGILFAKYRQYLKSRVASRTEDEQIHSDEEFQVSDWRDQVLILKSMGIIEVLKSRVQHPVERIKRQKIYRIICQIIGQSPVMTDSIGDYISVIEKPDTQSRGC